MQGADMRTVMEVLGPSRMATTSDLYTRVLAEVRPTPGPEWTHSCVDFSDERMPHSTSPLIASP